MPVAKFPPVNQPRNARRIRSSWIANPESPNVKNFDLAGPGPSDDIADLRKLWPVGGKIIEPGDQNHDSQRVSSQRILKLEILVQGDKDIKLPSGCFHQAPVRERLPSHFRGSLNRVSWTRQPKPGVHAFVKEDAHSFICSPASSMKR